MEDKENGRQRKWKMTKMEDDLFTERHGHGLSPFNFGEGCYGGKQSQLSLEFDKKIILNLFISGIPSVMYYITKPQVITLKS